MKRAVGWLTNKLWPTLPLWGMILAAALSVAFFVGAKAAGADITKPVWSAEWKAAIVADLSAVVLTAIVTGTVLKVLFFQKYFEHALTNIVFGDAGLDMLGVEKRVDLWKRLTCRIHAPPLHERLSDARLSELYKKLLEAEEKYIAYTKNFYVDQISRELEISWADRQNEIVQVKDFTEASLVPFDASREIEWVSETTAGANSDIAEYKIVDSDFQCDGEDPSKRRVEESKDRTKRTTTYFLSGKSSYRTSRTRLMTWKITKDPCYLSNSPYIIGGGSFKITNKLSGMQLIFQEIGGNKILQPVEGGDWLHEGDVARRRVAEVLLPRQGFQIIMIPRRQDVDQFFDEFKQRMAEFVSSPSRQTADAPAEQEVPPAHRGEPSTP